MITYTGLRPELENPSGSQKPLASEAAGTSKDLSRQERWDVLAYGKEMMKAVF